MIRLTWIGAALLIGSALAAAPAEAKAGDKAWSQCVWSQAPASADAWLGMPAPTWQTSYEEASVRLGHRLVALCDAAAADPLRPNRMPNWKSLAAALKRAKPKQSASAGLPSADVLLCRSTLNEGGQELPFLYEFVRQNGAKETISFQQHFGIMEGRAVKLPQDLRMVPKDVSAVKRTCSIIGANGELTNA